MRVTTNAGGLVERGAEVDDAVAYGFHWNAEASRSGGVEEENYAVEFAFT